MTQTHNPAVAYVAATNNHDPEAFIALFAGDAVVDDGGRMFHGVDAIRNWSRSDIFDVNVALEVLKTEVRDEETVITSKVDGTFDRTGLPDPVIITHAIKTEENKIVSLTCRLAN